MSSALPLIEELSPALRPEDAWLRLARHPHCLFLDSAMWHERLGRYSFLAADPFTFLQFPSDGSDALSHLERAIRNYQSERLSELPPFQGGAAGLFGYELGGSLERLPRPSHDEFQVPAMAVGLYDVVVAFDHVADRAWIISQGFPEQLPDRRRERAARRLAEVRGWLKESMCDGPVSTAAPPHQKPALAVDQFAPQFEVPALAGVSSNFSRSAYLAAVQRVIDYIYAGDVFQVNLAQRLLCRAHCDSTALYRQLRHCNPATFAGYFDLGDSQILSASPERFLKVADRSIETRPIKGTRPRTGDPAIDCVVEAELLQCEKDRSENVMIVDLLRNDLSRVSTPESVRVSQLCGIEAYEHVLHLVSAVESRLRDDCGPIDLLRAAFPGGSITGAPKVRAMEIITELESTARGAYCGSLGYLGFDGTMDLSILIRTITASRGWWQFPVGGGIVAQSCPENEYQETWHKAEGMLRAIFRCQRGGR